MVEPDGVSNDFRRKPMISIETYGTGGHISITACRVTAVQGPR